MQQSFLPQTDMDPFFILSKMELEIKSSNAIQDLLFGNIMCGGILEL